MVIVSSIKMILTSMEITCRHEVTALAHVRFLSETSIFPFPNPQIATHVSSADPGTNLLSLTKPALWLSLILGCMHRRCSLKSAGHAFNCHHCNWDFEQSKLLTRGVLSLDPMRIFLKVNYQQTRPSPIQTIDVTVLWTKARYRGCIVGSNRPTSV